MLNINCHFVIHRYEAILLLVILILTGSVFISTGSREPSLPAAPRYQPAIALTFDDGPHPRYTEAIITVLYRERVPATFFVVGRQALAYPHLVQSLALHGHEVEGHTFTHPNLARLTDREMAKELSLTRSIIRDITHRESAFFRPPGGRYTPRVVRNAGELGLTMVLWSVFPKDHEENDPRVIFQRVLAQAGDGGIVLLHSGMPATCEALPMIIRELKKRGYRFVTVAELYATKNRATLARLSSDEAMLRQR